MITHSPKHFADPDFLCRLREESLHLLLLPHSVFLGRHGFALPDGAWDAKHFDALASLLVSPPSDTPGSLIEAVTMIEALTSADCWHELLMEAPHHLAAVRDVMDSPADAALKIWLREPELIERVYTKFSLRMERRMVSCQPSSGAVVLKEPGRPVCDAMQRELALEFSDLFNTPACEVRAYEDATGFAFLIRHGEPIKRLGVYDDFGRPDTRAIRPLKHDFAHLNRKTGEFQVTGRSVKFHELCRQVFGRHLLGDAQALRPAQRYTLEPLRDGRECLQSPGIAEIDHARLRELRLRRREGSSEILLKADDVFDELEAFGQELLDDCEMVTGRFLIALRQSRRSLRLSLTPATDSLAGDHRHPVAIAWMETCRFARAA